MHPTDWEEEHDMTIEVDGKWWNVAYLVIVKDEKPVEIKAVRIEPAP